MEKSVSFSIKAVNLVFNPKLTKALQIQNKRSQMLERNIHAPIKGLKLFKNIEFHFPMI
jgi:hypothetical protein